MATVTDRPNGAGGPDEADGRDEVAERVSRHLPEITRWVEGRMGQDLRRRESVSDIVQSTVRELLRTGRYEDRGEAAFRRWLRVAAEHKIQNRARHWRSFGRGAAESLAAAGHDPHADGVPTPSEAAMLSEEQTRLAAMLAGLAPEHRTVVRRIQIEGASYAEVGSEMGRSPEAVRKLLARALARLSSALTSAPPSETD